VKIVSIMPKRKTENATIEVILLAADKHLGEKYEKVRVKPIFARNVLLPHNKAVLATPMNINNYRQKMESAQKEIEKKATDLKDLFTKIEEANGLLFVVKVNDEGGLYAKIDENDIVKKIAEDYKIDVPSHLFKMKKKITETGTYKVAFLYKEMKIDVQISVEAETPIKEHKSEVVEEVVAESAE
jgi:large subunit ribosomal protein L9